MLCRIDAASRRISSQCAKVLHVDVAADQAGDSRVLLRVAADIQALVGQITDARGEAETEQMHQAEHMVGEAGRVGVVFLDPQVGLVIQQAVQDVGGVAHRGVDDLDVERRVLVVDVGVELHARFLTVLQVHLCGELSPAASPTVITNFSASRYALQPLCWHGVHPKQDCPCGPSPWPESPCCSIRSS